MEISQSPKVDMRVTQSFCVGKVKPPNWLWSSLRAVSGSEMVRNGVLIIFSGEIGGRIGIFCNRYISGAITDREDLSGMEALKLLLDIKSGMFAFRPCLASEGAELKQDLAIDIQELLAARSTGGSNAKTPADVIGHVSMPSPEPQMGSIAVADGETNMAELADSLGTGGLFYTPVTAVQALQPDTPPFAASTQSSAPSSPQPAPASPVVSDGISSGEASEYLDWLAKDQEESGKRKSLGDILKPAILIPEIEGADEAVTTTGSFDLNKYRDLVQQESQKVTQQLTRAMGDSPIEITSRSQIMEDLRLFGEMLKMEGNRVNSWLKDDLDAIPTPKGAGGKSAGSGNRSQFAAECEDLISESMLAKFKESKFVAEAAPPPSVSAPKPALWQRHPRMAKAAGAAAACAVAFLGYQLFAAHETDALLDNAKSSIAAGRPQEAVSYLNDALQKSPDFARGYFYRGLAYQSLNEPDKSLKDLNKALSLGEPRSVLLPARAAVEISMHAYDKAIEDCTNAILDDPANAEAYRMRAVCHSRQENYGQAIEDCTTALKLVQSDESKSRVLAERGYAKAKNDTLPAAIEDFSESLKLKPSQWTSLQRADAYRALGKFFEADQDYSQVLKSEPNSYFALVARGICRVKLGFHDEAMKDFSQALRVNRTGVEALIQRGELELLDQQWQSAADDLQQAGQLNPNVVEVQQKLAIAVQHLKTALQPRTIAVETTKEIKLPSDTPSLMKMGYQFLNNGNVDEAVICFERCVSQEPRNPLPRRYLAYAYSQRGDFKQAVMYIQTLQGMGPLSAEDQLVLAHALVSSGQVEAAIDTLTESINKSPDHVPAYAELARIYMSRGFPQKARQIADQGLAKAKTAAQRQLIESAVGSRAGSTPHGHSAGSGSDSGDGTSSEDARSASGV